MFTPRQLEASDLNGLACVAEGRSLANAPHVAERLLAMGLIRKTDDTTGRRTGFELTSAGLDIIHSSDQ
jgi:predicted transcriptional regulator